MPRSLRYAAPALLAFTAVRALGLAVLVAWSTVVGRDASRLLVRWDAQWYLDIAERGYGDVRIHPDGRLLSDYAFFPLFPWSERAVAWVFGMPFAEAGLAVSWLASLGAAWGIFATGDHLYNRRVGVVLAFLWGAVPIGIVESMAYSEALFTALAAWSLYSVITRRWLWAGGLAALAGLTRPVGLAVVAAVVVTAAVVLLRERQPSWRLVGGALVAPLGWFGYVGWVGIEVGSPFGYFEVAGRWGNGFDGGIAFARWTWGLLSGSSFLPGVLVCLGLALLGWAFLLCVRQRQPVPLLIFCGVLVFAALTTSGYFGSKPRYLLPAFPLLLPAAVALSRLPVRRLAPFLALLAAGSAAYGAFWLHGPGPP